MAAAVAGQGFEGQCIHFRGALTRCAAGVDVERMRDPDLRLPCVAPGGCRGSVSCDEMQLPAPAESDHARDPRARQLSDALELLMDDRCPAIDQDTSEVCGQPITSEVESGGNVYAAPCGHLLAGRRRRRTA